MSMMSDGHRFQHLLDTLSMCVAEVEDCGGQLPARLRRHVLALLLLAVDEIELVSREQSDAGQQH